MTESRIIAIPRIATMFGSDSDLEQAVEAHQFLIEMAKTEKIKLFDEWTNSIHRHFGDVLAALPKLIGNIDALLVGAGWANQLTGVVNGMLRNFFRNDHIVVFGVAIEDSMDNIHTQTAIWSITELPSSEVVFNDYIGMRGCLQAAEDAAKGIYPVIKLQDWPTKKPAGHRTIERAVELGLKLRANKQ